MAGPASDTERQPPIEIHLAAWATDAAQNLCRRFGDKVILVVGVLRYPECEPWREHSHGRGDLADIDPSELTVGLDAPIVVASGRNAQGGLRIHNLTADAVVLSTNGHVTAEVVDPSTRAVVGGGTGIERLVLVHTPVPSDDTVVMPLFVGTASYVPELGYAIPAGEWALQGTLTLELGDDAGWQRDRTRSRRHFRTPLLPVTVTT